MRTPFVDDLVASGDLIVPFPRLRMRTGYRYFMVVNPLRARLPHVEAFRAWVLEEFRRAVTREYLFSTRVPGGGTGASER